MLLDSENTGNGGCIGLGTDDGVLWQTGICWIWNICGCMVFGNGFRRNVKLFG